jgi:hypothetical protein
MSKKLMEMKEREEKEFKKTVVELTSSALTSAPFSMRYLATTSCPRRHDKCKGV